MRQIIITISIVCSFWFSSGQSRKIIYIPDIPGYQTLKCDFHMHTVFSDGSVWPTIRVEEAWQEGLDAIAITDHIEYRPHAEDISSDHNRSYEIAEPVAKRLNLILIKGVEITRPMPPGHLNALFIKNTNLIATDDVMDAIKAARIQGAFIIWNHPGWKAQQPDTMLWWKEHTYLSENDLMHGIEVYNSDEFYPGAIDWAHDRKLALIAATDMHQPVNMAYDLEKSHRPMTLVFSQSRSEDGIREALFNRRTLAWFDNMLIGSERLLEPLFFASVKLVACPGTLKNGETRMIEIINNSEIDYELELEQPGVGFKAPGSMVLEAHRASVIRLTGNSDEVSKMKELTLRYKVKNMMISSSENLVISLRIPNDLN